MRSVRAAVLREIGKPPRIEEVRLASPRPGQVRVRLAATGICHSDLSIATGLLNHPTPVVLGHEGAGRVIEVTPGVHGLRVGDPVVLNWTPACGDCWYCDHGEPHLCAHAMEPAMRPYGTLSDGPAVHPGLGVAAFATETVVGENACVALPADLPLEQAALLGCAVLTGIGAVANSARVRAGESVVVLGLGGVGLAAVQGAWLARADPIIAIDPNPAKLELARSLGASDVLPPEPHLPRRIRELTGRRGADHAIECVGSAETIRLAWSCVRRGGHATIVGLGATTDRLAFNAQEIAHSARTLTGCMYGSSDPAADVPPLIDHVRAGTLNLAALITDRVSLDELPAAFAEVAAGRVARTMVLLD